MGGVLGEECAVEPRGVVVLEEECVVEPGGWGGAGAEVQGGENRGDPAALA